MIKRAQFLAFLLIITVPCLIAMTSGRAAWDSTPARVKPAPEPFIATQERPAAQEKTAEQVYKNIHVFKGVPATQLDAAMAFISGSLGVKCNYCHVNPFDKDDKPAKLAARKMIQMVFDLNKGSFNGQNAVSCYTCHRGQPQPVSVPALGQNLWQPPGQAAKQEAPLPSVDEILNHYVQAIGGRKAIERVTSRMMKGSRIGADGVLVPEEIYSKAPNKLLMVISYPKQVLRTGFNGERGWAMNNQAARDLSGEMLAQVKREAEFYKDIRLKEAYSKMDVLGRETIEGREAYVVQATPTDGSAPEKLFFDAQTGLLVRKYSETKMMLGQFPTETNYEDYREVEGVKLPFSIRWAIPGRVWCWKATEVKQNVPLADAQFDPPAAAK